tara:strand:- start:2555 stop:3121 length:567 start_codon:yes stop_codon:yes gene_type:complete
MLLEWQNRGLNLWTVKEGAITLVAGTKSYTLDPERVDVIEAMMRLNAGDATRQTDYFMERISISSYSQLTNKLTTGRPTQFWVERAPEAITLHLWPVPDSTQTYTFQYYYMERIEDSGQNVDTTVDIPSRYLPVLASGLAYYLALKDPKAFSFITQLKAIYDEQWDIASESHREKASLRLVPAAPSFR